jgi:hypothetical protein
LSRAESFLADFSPHRPSLEHLRWTDTASFYPANAVETSKFALANDRKLLGDIENRLTLYLL